MKRNKQFYQEKKLRQIIRRLDTLRHSTWRSKEHVPLKKPIHTGWRGKFFTQQRLPLTEAEKKITYTLVDILNTRCIEVTYNTYSLNTKPEDFKISNSSLLWTIQYGHKEFEKLEPRIQMLLRQETLQWGGETKNRPWEIKPKIIEKYLRFIEFKIIKEYTRTIAIIYPEEISEYTKLHNYLDKTQGWSKHARLTGHSFYDDWNEKGKKLKLKTIPDIEMHRDLVDRFLPESEIEEEVPFWVLAQKDYNSIQIEEPEYLSINTMLREGIPGELC